LAIFATNGLKNRLTPLTNGYFCVLWFEDVFQNQIYYTYNNHKVYIQKYGDFLAILRLLTLLKY
jgi:hypothetical protein